MLVLSRRPHERICITAPDGTQIWVTFSSYHPKWGKARIGIDAPQDYQINREEVLTQEGTRATAQEQTP